jgi:hypothetical protein
VDVEVVGRDLVVPGQPLQGGAPDLRVLAAVAVEDAHVELVVDVDDAARRLPLHAAGRRYLLERYASGLTIARTSYDEPALGVGSW